MQRSVDTFSAACNSFELTINIRKTVVMHLPAPGELYVESNISINEQRINVVDKFTYVGNTLSRNVMIDDEINTKTSQSNCCLW